MKKSEINYRTDMASESFKMNNIESEKESVLMIYQKSIDVLNEMKKEL